MIVFLIFQGKRFLLQSVSYEIYDERDMASRNYNTEYNTEPSVLFDFTAFN